MNKGAQTDIRKSLFKFRISCSAIAFIPLLFAVLSLVGGKTTESVIFVIMAITELFLTLALTSFLNSVLLAEKA